VELVLVSHGSPPAFFIAYLLTFLLLYLACAFALPDPEWEKSRTATTVGEGSVKTSATQAPLDLEAFYFSASHRRWFFGVFIAFIVMSQVGSQTARALSEGFGVNEQELFTNGVAIAFIGTLLVTDRWWVHVCISVPYFLAVGWTTTNSILGFL
jgi:hypothetical protein